MEPEKSWEYVNIQSIRRKNDFAYTLDVILSLFMQFCFLLKWVYMWILC